MSDPSSRANRLDRAIADLLAQAPEVEAAAVVSFDGLPMASALPATMDEDRVAAMSAALLSLGERAAEGLGRGGLNQVYIEGEHGTVFLVSADDEAVLVAVASKAAKVGMMLYEVRRAAIVVAEVLRSEQVVTQPQPVAEYAAPVAPVAAAVPAAPAAPVAQAAPVAPVAPVTEAWETPVQQPVPAAVAATSFEANPLESPIFPDTATETTWPSYLPTGTTTAAEQTPWA
jgi:predicted regulator of Ras-like GTPase activity (Roadblock/LC7/MglB family)